MPVIISDDPIFKRQLPRGFFSTYNDRPKISLLKVKQVHSTKLISIDRPSQIELFELGEGDGMIFPFSGHFPSAILTADCMPIVILGKNGHAFLHSGWKGLKEGILTQQSLIDIDPEFAFIGPHIHSCCFEVKEDFFKNFPTSQNFIVKNKLNYFDLNQEAIHQLKSTFHNIKIETTKICTCCHHHFHSYRRDKTSNRNWNLWLP